MKENDWLRWGVILLILAAFFTPLIVANSLFFPFITGKNFAFRILVELAFALWVILALRDPSARPRLSLKDKGSWMFYAFSALVIIMALADALSPNPVKSFWSNFERMEGWIGLVHLYALFVILWSSFREGKWWRMIFETTVGVAVAEACFGVLQLFHQLPINQGGVRADGTFGNAAYLAVYMLMTFFLTLFLFVRRKTDRASFAVSYGAFIVAQLYTWVTFLMGNAWPNAGAPAAFLIVPHLVIWGAYFLTLALKRRWLLEIWLVLAGLLELLMVYSTETRGAIAGLAAGIFVAFVGVIFFGNASGKVKRISAIILVILVLIAGGLYLARNTSFVQHQGALARITNISSDELKTRFTLWHMAWQGVTSSPQHFLIGWGQESFNYVFNYYYKPSLWAQEPWFDRAHNAFVDWAVAGGLLGFLFYLSLFALAFRLITKKGSSFSVAEGSILLGFLAAYAVNNLVVFDNLLSSLLFFTFLAYIAARASSAETVAGAPAGKPVSDGMFWTAMPIAVVLMIAVLYYANVPGMATASDLINALKSQPSGLSTNLSYLEKAGNATGLGRQEAHEQAIQFAVQAKSQNIGDATFQTQVEQYAVKAMTDEVTKVPNDARLRLFLGSALRQFGDVNDARTQLEKAHELSPKKQSIYFELGLLEANAGNPTAALEWFKEAYELDTAFDTARDIYAAALLESGDLKGGAALLVQRYGNVTPDDDIILNAFLVIHDYADAETIVKNRLASDQSNLQLLVELASIQLQGGDRTGSIATLQAAIAANPSFKTQGQTYIDEIASGKTP